MRKIPTPSTLIGLFALFALISLSIAANEPAAQQAKSNQQPEPDWAMNATIIEACSCPMFCQCYFDTKPAAHGGEHAAHGGAAAEHFCKMNNAFKVNSGHYGDTKLDGAKFWV